MIILSSASPRRQALLQQLIGDTFSVIISDYEETPQPELSPEELVMHHSVCKAASITQPGIIIAADTVVLCDNKILGKPLTDEEAAQMLGCISGKKIRVITGLTVRKDSQNKTCFESTDVYIRKISKEEISSYIATAEPFGKAGAFAIQGKGVCFAERIDGDPFNVVGLPLFKLSETLPSFGVDIFRQGLPPE